MKRDMDVVRAIALALADLPPGESMRDMPGLDMSVFGMHAAWMEEAGLIKGIVRESMDGDFVVILQRLTWEGCDFADAVRSDTLWAKAKTSVIKPATSFTFGLLKDWLSAEIREGFPTLR